MAGDRATPHDDLSALEGPDGAIDLGGSERDGVASLHDVEAESGDEVGLRDGFLLDREEARELGVQLDPAGDEPQLD
jgi:hypothetical protein